MSGDPRPALPPEVVAVLGSFRTCELTTLSRAGGPVTWPVVFAWHATTGLLTVSTSIGWPQKAFNVRRDPRVSMLFSDPTASGLVDPPVVLVQGEASAPDEISTSPAGIEDELREHMRRQPSGRVGAMSRHLLDWYAMRLRITVTPRRVRWWPDGDLDREPLEVTTP